MAGPFVHSIIPRNGHAVGSLHGSILVHRVQNILFTSQGDHAETPFGRRQNLCFSSGKQLWGSALVALTVLSENVTGMLSRLVQLWSIALRESRCWQRQ